MNLDKYNYDELCSMYVDGYANLFGNDKAKKVWEMMLTSTKLKQLIKEHVLGFQVPEKVTFEYLINSIGYFMFSKPETHTLGVITAIDRYVREGDGISMETSQEYFADMVREVIQEAGVTYVPSHSEMYIKSKARSSTNPEMIAEEKSIIPTTNSQTVSKEQATVSKEDEEYKRMIETCETFKEGNVVLLSVLTHLYLEHKEFSKAEESFEEVMKLNPEPIFTQGEEWRAKQTGHYFKAVYSFVDYCATTNQKDRALAILIKVGIKIKDYLTTDEVFTLFRKRVEVSKAKVETIKIGNLPPLPPPTNDGFII
jgi:hypothetical protein